MTRHATVRTRSGRLKLSITAHAGTKSVAYLRKHLTAAWPLIENAPKELSIALVNDDRMALLHKQFLGIEGPTDVLTFELDHDDATGHCTGGEVIVCVPEAERRAKDLGADLADELLLYSLHGLLHLSGFDDRTPSDFKAMHQREDQILKQIGIGKLFHRPPSSRPRGRKRS